MKNFSASIDIEAPREAVSAAVLSECGRLGWAFDPYCGRIEGVPANGVDLGG